MLARKLILKSDEWGEVGATPMLIPSISSRLNIEYKKTIEVLSALIRGPFLLSAYDFFYTNSFPKINFPELVFLDSGGYETLIDKEVSEFGLYKPDPKEWDSQKHQEAIRKWNNEIPTVIVSYDHPSERFPIDRQIENAKNLFRNCKGNLKELLIKSETKNSRRVTLDGFYLNIDKIADFDIIGFTEKELGYSIFERMVNIVKIRQKMEENSLEIPLHIFGSLDTITTPLYFIAGADIFDGLSYLRFAFDIGTTQYINSYGPEKFGVHTNLDDMWIRSVEQNYIYLNTLKFNLDHLQSTGDFTKLGEKSQFFRDVYDDLNKKIGGTL